MYSNFIDNSLIQSTFFLKYGNSTGTCFTFNQNNKQYLITAKHIINDCQNGDKLNVEIYHENKWKNIDGNVFFNKNKNVDIAVISLSFQLAMDFGIQTECNLILGMDVYFLGFPYGLYQDSGNINRDFPLPFIKKGIFSAIRKNVDDGTIYFLDGHNNKGFSGGPVGHYDPVKKMSYLHGVISGYIPQKGEIETPFGNFLYNENSGIVIVYSIEHVKEIINEII